MVDNLCFLSSAMKAPDIFLLLPLCPLLQEDQNVINLALPLAVAITNLGETNMETLRKIIWFPSDLHVNYCLYEENMGGLWNNCLEYTTCKPC